MDEEGEDSDHGVDLSDQGESDMAEEYDSSDFEDDTDDATTVKDRVGPPPSEPPEGFEYVDNMPDISTDSKAVALVGSHILHAFDSPSVKGWFMGRISARGCSVTDQRKTPGVNFVVTYTRALTQNKNLVGRVASTLTAERYGPTEWWVLLAQKQI